MSAVLATTEVTMQRQVLQQVFDRYHAAWEAKDPDAIVALHGEDSTFALRSGGARVRGRAALRRHFAEFNAEGTAAALATVITLATLCLVLPQFTTSAPGPEFTTSQLVFAAIASLALYLLFVFVQTVRHREHFVPGEELEQDDRTGGPNRSEALRSLILLLAALAHGAV